MCSKNSKKNLSTYIQFYPQFKNYRLHKINAISQLTCSNPQFKLKLLELIVRQKKEILELLFDGCR